MMATVSLTGSSLLPLLETLEDSTAGEPEQTDAYLTITNRLSGEEGQQFLPAVVKHFPRLGKTIQTHMASEHVELSQAALHALGFCVFHFKVVAAIPASFAEELLTALSSLMVKSTHKSVCTRALWVIAKQNFPQTAVAKKVPEVLQSLERVSTREDIQSVVMEHEALNVVIRLLEQAPVQMGEGAVQWARLVVPLVVHSAPKVRLRAAAALEMGMPLLLQRQQEVAAVIEPLMATKLIPELQKLFSSKNEANVLKLWALFVKLLGKLLHRGGPFINSLLQLEEMGFRSSSANIKNIAFIAWKSLIDNFALNPDILCSAKRLRLLMQPLHSIQVRMEALLLTKLEVWWYLMVKLGPNMPANFEQVGLPLLQCTLGLDSAVSARSSSHSAPVGASTPKAGPLTPGFSSPATPRLNLNSSVHAGPAYPSVQQLGLEMLLHYFLGPEVTATAARNKLVLSLEPLTHPLLSSPSSFSKHASLLVSLVRDGFVIIGGAAPEALLTLIWKNLVVHVSTTLDSGNKKDRQGCEVLTLMLQALQTIVSSEVLSAQRILGLLEITGRGVPPRVLGSASYQVGKMDVLNGTPALFLIQLLLDSKLVSTLVEDERFLLCLETLVGVGLSGPTSALAFGEAVLGAVGRSAATLEDKERLLSMWSRVVVPLTDVITQTNEVNQGDALEHNFSAAYSALMFPITHLLPGSPLSQASQSAMLATWARLYKVLARCSALVVTAEENVCCEELCAKMSAVLDTKTLPTLEAVAQVLLVVIESVDFSPYTPHFQQKTKSPHTPRAWVRKRRALGNLSSYLALLVQCLESLALLEGPEAGWEAAGLSLVSILSCLFSSLALGTAIQEALACLALPLTVLYQQAERSQNEQPKFSSMLAAKLEKLLADLLSCLQTRSSLAYDSDLLQLLSPLLCVLFPHRSRPLRSLLTQFWNATFANTAVLTYPDQLKPVLSQVKQKTPIILPGFQVVEVPDELGGQCSSESSQLETKLSGVQVSSVGKRDSLLARAGDMKDRNAKTPSKPASVSTKLDFGSPAPPRREALEEEASVDFVFIPPETKERVLTEHQKEVKRTKRVDIPAMYNNLDTSLDTTVFSQYTQSQGESMDKRGADDQTGEAAKEGIMAEVAQENTEDEVLTKENTEDEVLTKENTEDEVLTKENTEDEVLTKENTEDDVLTKETQDYVSQTAADVATGEPEKDADRPATRETPPESPDVSVEAADGDATAEATDPRDGASPNTSSDLFTGTTPQKLGSVRRQAFITLEKYVEGKAASPIRVTKFTGPLTRTSNSQEPSSSPSPSSSSSTPSQAGAASSPQASQAGQGAPEGSENTQQQRGGGTSEKEAEPEAETAGKRPSERAEDDVEEEEDDDVIPDTQAEGEQKAPVVEEVEADSQESPQGLLEGSQCSPSHQASLGQGEPRRSGRRRSKPLWQEESDAKEERDKKKTTPPQTDSQSPRRASRRLEVLVKDKRKRRGASEEELSQSGSTSDSDSQSQGRRSLRIKLAVEAEGESLPKRRSRATKEEGSSQVDSPSQLESQTRGRDSQKGMLVSGSEEFVLRDQGKRRKKKKEEEEKDEDAPLSQGDSQEVTPSSASRMDSQSQGRPGRRSKVLSESQELVKVDAKRSRREGAQDKLGQSDLQTATPPSSVAQSDGQSHGRSGRRGNAASQSEESVKDERTGSGGADAMLGQSDSQTATPSPATQPDGQSQGGSIGTSKMSVEVAESDQSQNVVSDVAEKETVPTDSQLTHTTGRQTDGQKMHSRPTRLKLAQQQAKPSNSPSSSPAMDAESSQGTQEHSQGRRRTTRRRAHQLSGSNTEKSESDSSEAREEVPKTSKRGRKSKSSETTPSPLTVVPLDPTDSSETSGKSEPQNKPTSETETPKDAEELLTSQDSLVVRLPFVTENIMEQGEAPTQEDMEGQVSEQVGPVTRPEKAETDDATSQMEESSAGSDAGVKPPVRPSLRKRSRAKGRSQPDTSASQEAVSSQSQLSEDPGANGNSQPQDQQATDPTQAGAPVPSPASSVVPSGDGVSMDPSAPCTPPLSNESSSGSADKGENLILQVSESSEEKVSVPDVPQPGEEKQEPAEEAEEKEVPMEEPEEEEEVPIEEKEVPTEEVVPIEEKEVPTEEEVPIEEKEVPTEEEVAEEQVPDHDEKPAASVEAPEEDRQDAAIAASTGDVPAECSNALEEQQLQQREVEPYTPVEERQPDGDSSSTRTRGEGEEEAQAEADHNALSLQDRVQASAMEEAEEETQIDDDLDMAPRAAGDSHVPLADLPASGLPVATNSADPCQDSPAKQRGLEALVGPEVGQSPSSKTRGVWSPMASPSTSILKKGLKRAFEEESPSSLIKSRRVSFADPIHHQELADDIDRRSPVIRTSAPRTSSPKTACSIPQLKYITTPTKGLVTLSPRSLHSPGYKSSKKCLISEMGQEPRAIPRDCVYPALVSCSTPVEAVLPKITSNVWPRGFGHLVRARNIKTVGDLSALTPSEIKTLPIRSPKISNVKKALKTYHEQQRKGRGDELKSFDETEKMTSEVEDASVPPAQEDEDKALATALLDEPMAVEQEGPQQDQTPQGGGAEGLPRQPKAQGLLSEAEALMTPEGLGRCSGEQLFQLHDQLGAMMRSVVVQLKSRLSAGAGRP